MLPETPFGNGRGVADTERVGRWGFSVGGSLEMHVQSRDPRVPSLPGGTEGAEENDQITRALRQTQKIAGTAAGSELMHANWHPGGRLPGRKKNTCYFKHFKIDSSELNPASSTPPESCALVCRTVRQPVPGAVTLDGEMEFFLGGGHADEGGVAMQIQASSVF